MRSGVGLKLAAISLTALFADAVRGVLFQAPSISHDGEVVLQSVTVRSDATKDRNVSSVGGSQKRISTTESYQFQSEGNTSRAGFVSHASSSILATLSLDGYGILHVFTFVLFGGASVIGVAIIFWLFGWSVVRIKKHSPSSEESASDDSDTEPWASAQLVDNLLAQSGSIDIQFVQPSWTSATVKKILQDYGINIQSWRPEHYDFLARELAKGRVRLCKDGEMLVRVLDIVIVMLTYEPEYLVLQECIHPSFKRGGFQEIPEKTLKTRLQPGESPMDAAARCLRERLELNDAQIEGQIRIHPDILNVRETREMNDSLPGLTSNPRFFIIESKVTSTDAAFLRQLGIPSRTKEIGGFEYTWENMEKVPRIQKHLRYKYATALEQHGIRCKMLDPTPVAVIPWTDTELAKELGKHGKSDASMPFGRSLESLLKGLQEGRLALGVRGTGKSAYTSSKLLCVSQEVSVVVQTRKGKVLVTDDTGKQRLKRVPPSSKKVFVVGDHVRVIKESRLKGKTAVVLDRNWNGLVKVNMDEEDSKGAIKSFKAAELELYEESAASSRKSQFQATKLGKHQSLPPVLPSAVKFSNEGVWMAAFRLAQLDLRLSVPIFSMDASLLCVADHLSHQDDFVRREFIVRGPTWPRH